LFPEGDLAGLIEAVRRLAGDRGLAHNLAGRGIERAATAFDWSVIMQHHERAFSEAMATA
jgi:glycosyltransferase involved in cell wall biosynthesis